jgi:hypothetical protein
MINSFVAVSPPHAATAKAHVAASFVTRRLSVFMLCPPENVALSQH